MYLRLGPSASQLGLSQEVNHLLNRVKALVTRKEGEEVVPKKALSPCALTLHAKAEPDMPAAPSIPDAAPLKTVAEDPAEMRPPAPPKAIATPARSAAPAPEASAARPPSPSTNNGPSLIPGRSEEASPSSTINTSTHKKEYMKMVAQIVQCAKARICCFRNLAPSLRACMQSQVRQWEAGRFAHCPNISQMMDGTLEVPDLPG